MCKFIKLLLLILFFCIQVKAQNSDFAKAYALFSDDKFSAAQALFHQLIVDDKTNEKANYYNAKCSKELFASDALFLYDQFIESFPYTSFLQEVNKDLALLYYRDLDYPKAINYFLQLKNLDQNPELIFKLAYANFSIDSLVDAQYYFSKLINVKSKYNATARYYSSCIAYQNGLYTKALNGFKYLIPDEQFGSIIPYYITQIYFFQQSYKKLITFASPLLETVIPSRKAEVNRLLAEAYYRTEDFENAIINFTAYCEQVDQVNPIVNFLLGQSYFKSGEFENAINYLEKISGSSDSIGQYASYSLGASYLKVQQFNYALQAFKKSASYSYDKVVQEEAFYNYAKLSYQLDLPFDNTLLVLKTYLEKFDNVIHKKHIETLMVQVFQSSSKYDEAFDALLNISSPNVQQQASLQQFAFFLGTKEYNADNYNKALNYFQLASQYPIDDKIASVAVFWMADCYYQLKDFARSAEIYTSLSINNTTNFEFYYDLKQYYLAYAYFKLGEYKLANTYFRKYEKLVVDSMYLNDTYLRIADCFFMSQEYSLSEKYYDKAIAYSLFDCDYAIYQRSLALGLIEKNNTKLKLLKHLTSDFVNSIYFDNALYDLAHFYKNTSKNDLALTYYDKLLEKTKDKKFIADSYLSKGMIYFNSGKVDQAIASFLFVVNNFQQTIYFKEALSGLQAAYVSLAKVNDYLAIINSLPEISLSKSEQDSLIYNTAFMKFSQGDYLLANTTFNQYLEKFENGIFKIDAIYYNAVSCVKVGDTVNAVLMFTELIGISNAEYQQSALTFLARKYYTEDDYDNSNIYYQTLEKVALNNSLKREAIIRLMYGNEKLKPELAYNYAQKVINLDKTDDWLISKAKIIVARGQFFSGNYAKSKTTFEKVVELSDYDEGAEAKYYLAYLMYLDDSLALAEKMIFELAKNYNSDYFIAKAFILLADIYVLQENDFQAKATLESIIENHDGEELVNLARKNWELIIERESVGRVIKDNPQSYIEFLEEEIDYDLTEFLIEDVIEEEYREMAPENLIVPKTDNLGITNEYIEIDEIE